jgi:hypothetical protein
MKQPVIGTSKLGNTIACSDFGNRHVTITGSSGFGKSHLGYTLALQALAEGMPVVVLDLGSTWTEIQLPQAVKDYIRDKSVIYDGEENIAINPCTCKLLPKGVETPREAASRVGGILRTSLSFGDCQFSALLQKLEAMLTEYVKGESEFVTLDELYTRLAKSYNHAPEAAAKLLPILGKIRFSYNPEEVWDNVMDRSNPKLTIFQFSSLGGAQRAAVNFILDDLYRYISINGSMDKPFVVSIDELQKIAVKTNGEQPIDVLLNEGRKFGAGVIAATQGIDFSIQNKLYKALGNSATRIYFKPAQSEIPKVARRLSYDSKLNWKAILSDMGVGCCIVENGSTTEYDKLVKVPKLEQLIDKL